MPRAAELQKNAASARVDLRPIFLQLAENYDALASHVEEIVQAGACRSVQQADLATRDTPLHQRREVRDASIDGLTLSANFDAARRCLPMWAAATCGEATCVMLGGF